MSAIALNQHLSGIIAAPPEVDWARAFEAVETLKDLERIVSLFDADSLKWRTTMMSNMVDGLDRLRRGMTEFPEEEARAAVLPLVDRTLIAVEDLRRAYELPFHNRPDFAERMTKLGRISGGAGRFIRKQFKRVEDVRVAQYNAAIDVYYGLLAFRSEIEDDHKGVAAFSDPVALGDFLRRQMA